MLAHTNCARGMDLDSCTSDRSQNRGTTRLLMMRTWPGTTGLRLTEAKESSEEANTSED